MKKTKKLSSEIIALYTVLMFIVLCLLILQSALFSYPQLLTRTNEFLQEKNRHLSTFIEGYFREIINGVKILSKNPDIIEIPYADVATQKRALAMLKDFQTTNSNIYYIYAGYANDFLLINDYEAPEGYSVFTRPWYRAVMDNPQSNKMVVGLLYREAKTKELLISMIHILESPQYGFTGALAIDSYTRDIAHEIQRYSEGFKTSYSFITDQNFKIIVHPKQYMLDRNLLSEIDTKDILKPERFFRYSVDGIRKIAFVSYIDLTGWYIFTTVNELEMIAPIIRNFFIYLSFTTVVLGLFAILTLYGLHRKVLKPLAIVLRRLEKISNGIDELPEAGKMPNNEIGIISANIEKLTASALYQKNAELTIMQKRILKINEELEEKNKILEKVATHDFLTGIYNRRKIEEKVFEEHEKYLRYKISYSLIIFDIDNFKSINDTYGHKTGDEVLVSLCRIAKENIRKTDSLGRWGGEEFIVLLFNTPLENAKNVAEKLRMKVEKADFSHHQRVTISIGVGEIKEGETLDVFIRRVDSYAYEAKKAGKNRTVAK